MDNLRAIAIALYDGGWRAIDKEWIMDEYKIIEDEVTYICEILAELEERTGI